MSAADNIRKYINLVESMPDHVPSDDWLAALEDYVLGEHHHDETGETLRILQAEMPKLSRNYKVYRGIGVQNWETLHPATDFRERDIIDFPGMVSTSLSRTEAEDFMHGSLRLLFQINVRAGMDGVVVNDYLDHTRPAYRDYGYQQELLLPHGYGYRVLAKNNVSRYQDEEKWEVHLEMVE